MARRGVAPTLVQQVQAFMQSLRHALHAEQRHPRCGQFQRERQTVQAGAQRDDRAAVVLVQDEIGLARAHALDEERHRAEVLGRGHLRRLLRVGPGQRRHAPDLFALHPQRLLRGCQHANPGDRRQHLRRQRRHSAEQVFAVVQNEQQRQRG